VIINIDSEQDYHKRKRKRKKKEQIINQMLLIHMHITAHTHRNFSLQRLILSMFAW
jgi:accessory gene regulator protein AgrB